MPGQPNHPPVLSFNCSNIQVYEAAGSLAPTTIVSAAAPFDLSADFAFSDTLATGLVNLLASQPAISHWNITYSAESLGPGPEVPLGAAHGIFISGQLSYTNPATRITVPAGSLTPGVYKLVGVVTLPNLPGVTGFYEGPTIQVY